MPGDRVTGFGRLYRHLSGRRRGLFAATLLLIALAAAASTRLSIQEDVAALLPDDGSEAAAHFRLLDLAPFTKKVVISIKGSPAGDPDALVAVADRLAGALREKGVGSVATGPADLSGSLHAWLGASLPSLAAPRDLERLAAATTPTEVRARLEKSYEELLSPQGWATKGNIQADPLSFSELGYAKLSFVNLVPNMRLVQNHFVSADGTSALVTVDTAVPMTDSAASRELVDKIDAAVAASVPAGYRASVVSGHLYTLANAETIKRDLYLVLSLSVIAVFAVYLLFLRSWSAAFVFLVPSSVLIVASGAMALWAPHPFGVTLGFGGVLLGMVDEYAMMIYFSCRKGGRDRAEIVSEVSRPVLFGALATLLSFAVMLNSSLPGQRQLAIYSMTGIVAALAVSLVVLPHLVGPAPLGRLPLAGLAPKVRLPRRAVIGIWLALVPLCAWQAGGIRFNGELQAISMVTPELKEAEDELARTWGGMRAKALVFAEGKDLEEALRLNDRVFARLSAKLPAGELVSIAPILPSASLQEENRSRWLSFWGDGRAARLEAELGRAGTDFGFAQDAFDPFLATFTQTPQAAGLEGLRRAGMGELVDALVLPEKDRVRVLTLVPDTPEVVDALSREFKDLPGVKLVSQTRFGATMGRAIIDDFTRYLALTSVLVAALIAFLFRDLKRALLVLVPVATGLTCMLGIMGMLGLEFNIFNIAATILIIGLCVDYGIFMVCRLADGEDGIANRSVLVSGLTTLAGLGALALARHPSMQSIGVTVLLGIGTGIPAALFVIPALWGREER